MEKGYLVVQVYLSAESFGVKDVKVSLSDGRVLYTDENGFTEKVVFDTPNREESMHPGNSTPFSTVNMTLEKDGFFTIQLNHVQIFPQETTLQKVRFLPLPENGGGGTIVFDLLPQNL